MPIKEITLEQMNPSAIDRVIKLKRFQDGFIFSAARYPAAIMAWGTGKTMGLIERSRIACETYPKNLGVIFRKTLKDLADSTVKDFELYTGIKVNSERNANFPNGSQIMFRHAEELNNIQNINLGFFGIEQAEELDADDIFFMLQGRLRRLGCPHWGAVIGNPKGHNWIYKLWKANPQAEYELFEATTFDNEDVLPKDYIESLRTLKETKPKIYNRFVMNSWEESDTVDQIIQSSWIQTAVASQARAQYPIRKIVSIDVARGGSDSSVFHAVENFNSIGREEHRTRNTMELVGRAVLFAKGLGIKSFAVDEIGVGGGVADRIRELGYRVVFVNAAHRVGVPAPYYNRRSEVLGFAAKMFEEGRVKLNPKHEALIEQLSWTKWKPIKSTGILQAESKDDIRERYGKSPDDADAFLNGLWSVMQVEEEKNKFTSHEENVGWTRGSYVPEWSDVGEREVYVR